MKAKAKPKPKRKPKPRRAWLVRMGHQYVLFGRQPRWCDYAPRHVVWDGDYLKNFCRDDWESLTGIKLPERACVEVAFTRTARGFSVRICGKPITPPGK